MAKPQTGDSLCTHRLVPDDRLSSGVARLQQPENVRPTLTAHDLDRRPVGINKMVTETPKRILRLGS